MFDLHSQCHLCVCTFGKLWHRALVCEPEHDMLIMLKWLKIVFEKTCNIHITQKKNALVDQNQETRTQQKANKKEKETTTLAYVLRNR